MTQKKIKLAPQARSITLDRAAVQQDSRTISLAFASEQPVERYWGIEILDMSPGAMRTGRMKSGAPLLCDHDTCCQVGIVEDISLGTDRVARADVRFGKSARAEQEYQDVIDGIRTNVSVGYIIHEMQAESEKDGITTWRVIDWEPYEISMVSVPADYIASGVGRSVEEREISITVNVTAIDESETTENEIETETAVSDPTSTETEERKPMEPNIQEERNAARKEAQTEVREILAIASKRPDVLMDAAREFITTGKTLDEFRTFAMERLFDAKPVQVSAEIGLNDKEARSFSILRAINAMANPNDRNAQAAAAFELDCSRSVEGILRKAPQGFYIPMDVQKRDLTVGTGNAGGYTKQTDVLGGSFIEMLRNRMMTQRMGATVLSGLVGDIAIPGQSGGATAYWVAENTAVTKSQQTISQVAMAPKTVGAFTDVSRKLLNQSSIDINNLVQSDLAKVLALAIDVAALHGPGTGNAPTGIAATAGIGSVAGGTNGAAPTFANMISLWSEVAIDNADLGSLGFLTNSKAIGKLMSTQKVATYGNDFIVNAFPDVNGFTNIHGMRAGVSNQVASNLVKAASGAVCSAIFFGNWADLLIGQWGGLDVLVDPYTGGAAGTVRVRVLQDVDIAVRHAESFSAMLDALTT
jgi:HK97 family phage major capsid protein